MTSNKKFVFLLFCFFSIIVLSQNVSAANVSYGEIYNRTDTGYTFTIANFNTYYNITLPLANCNISENMKCNGTALNITVGGIYYVSGYLSVGLGIGGQYGFGIVKNFQNPEENGKCYMRKQGVNQWDTLSTSCIYNLSEGDTLSWQVVDETNPASDARFEVIHLTVHLIKYNSDIDAEKENYIWFYIIMIAIAMALFYIGKNKNDNNIILLSGMFFVIIGLVYQKYGFPYFTTAFINDALWLILVAAGFYIIGKTVINYNEEAWK
jgi:hypothetical protein